MGGISEEKEISILSGRACVRALKKGNNKVKFLDQKEILIMKIEKLNQKMELMPCKVVSGKIALIKVI